jgi:hypothetical protein
MKTLIVGAVAVTALIAGGCGSSSDSTSTTPPTTAGTASKTSAQSESAASLAPVHGAYNPSIDPADFVATVDNRYLPFTPGTALHYEGVAEDGKTPQTDDEVVTHQKKRILGVNATIVRDVVSERGKPIERTFDWYAQDKQGNVWYMGEDAREFHHGKFVKAPDSWQGGVNGAQPGIIMPGNPQPGDAYRQEYYPGHALDQARVVGAKGTINVPAGAYKRPLVTVETSALEPGAAEQKFNAPGVGVVKEQVVRGNHERFVLTSVTRR